MKKLCCRALLFKWHLFCVPQMSMPETDRNCIFSFLWESQELHDGLFLLCLKLVLHNAIFLTTCLRTLEKGTRYTFQFCAATCSGLKTSLQSLQKIKRNSTANVTRCNFLCNLAMALQDKLQHVTGNIRGEQRQIVEYHTR